MRIFMKCCGVLLASVSIIHCSVNASYGNEPPQNFDFSVEYVYDDIWYIYGYVEDESLDGVRVYFTGVADEVVSVNNDGTFYLVLNVSQSGMISAVAYDSAGEHSPIVSDYISLQ